jgi:hypothetical protein
MTQGEIFGDLQRAFRRDAPRKSSPMVNIQRVVRKSAHAAFLVAPGLDARSTTISLRKTNKPGYADAGPGGRALTLFASLVRMFGLAIKWPLPIPPRPRLQRSTSASPRFEGPTSLRTVLCGPRGWRWRPSLLSDIESFLNVIERPAWPGRGSVTNGICQIDFCSKNGRSKLTSHLVVDARLRPLWGLLRVSHKDLIGCVPRSRRSVFCTLLVCSIEAGTKRRRTVSFRFQPSS